MIYQQGVDALAHQKALDSISDALREPTKGAYRATGAAGRRVENALYGTWLGHPLHPALTDIAIGAWTVTFGLDLLSAVTTSKSLARCANAALVLGTLAGMPTVASGLTDNQHPTGEARRIGAVHGVLNISIELAQIFSLVQRTLGNRGWGRFLSALAYGGVIVSGYLGGELVEKYRIGVNRAAGGAVPIDFVPVMAETDLPENEPRQVQVAGSPMVLVRQGEHIYAMHATCTHLGGPLAQGMLVDGAIQCPWHTSRFAVDDGHVVKGPATFPERCFATRVRNGQIEVGPGAALGRCEHEPVPAHVPAGQEAATARA